MGIKIHTDRTLAARDKEKDDKITKLERDIKALVADAATMEQALIAKDQRITALIAEMREPARDPETERMLVECYEKISGLTKHLDMAHAVERNQAEVIKQQSQALAALQKTNEEFEQAYGEYGLFSDETVLFLKRIATGANIKRDQTGGKELIARAKELLLQYGHGEKPVTGDTQ